MKRIIKAILFLLVIFPIYIYAFTYKDYDSSKNYVNTYINQFSDKNKYIMFSEEYSEYSNGHNIRNTSFYNGGLLSYDEYEVSARGSSSSYLAIGREYWTLSSNGYNQYYVDNTILSKSKTSPSGARVTEFVRPEIYASGNGSYSSPWVFNKQYNVNFRVNNTLFGSVSPKNKTVNPSDTVEATLTENRGYMYVGCDCNVAKKNAEEKVYVTYPIRKDTVCTFTFDRRKITINYSCTGGEGTVSPQTVRFGDAYTIADYSCTRKGYTQTGWKTAGGDLWNKGSYSNFDADEGEKGISNNKLSLIPVWTANNYPVAYSCSNATSGSMTDSTATYDADFITKENAFKRTGYKFTGWNEKADGTGVAWTTESYGVFESEHKWKWKYDYGITLYCQWTPKSYTVTYNGNGATSGRMTDSSATFDVDFITKKNEFSRTGYTYNGWNEAANGSGTPWNLDSAGVFDSGNKWKWKYDKSITLYVNWKPNTYTVTYDGNGATSGSMTASTATYNADFITKENKFSMTGYSYNGWNEKADGTGVAWTTESNGVFDSGNKKKWIYDYDITLYVSWKPKTYTVKYNGNGATSGSMTDSKATYKTSFMTKENAFERTGYTFIGWNEKADGSGTPWTLSSNGVYESDKYWTWNYTSDITLYAQWKQESTPKTIKVTFDKNDGSGKTVTQTFTAGQSGNRFGYNTDGTPKWTQSGDFGAWTWTNHFFGWSKSKNAVLASYDPYSYVSDNWINSNEPEITLYAVTLHWTTGCRYQGVTFIFNTDHNAIGQVCNAETPANYWAYNDGNECWSYEPLYIWDSKKINGEKHYYVCWYYQYAGNKEYYYTYPAQYTVVCGYISEDCTYLYWQGSDCSGVCKH